MPDWLFLPLLMIGVFIAVLAAIVVGAIIERRMKGPRVQPRVFDRSLRLVRKD